MIVMSSCYTLDIDVCLPALFMPSRMGTVYSPKAALYFHPSGSSNNLLILRIMKNKIPLYNGFDYDESSNNILILRNMKNKIPLYDDFDNDGS